MSKVRRINHVEKAVDRMNAFFPEIKKKLGFGCMRLPVNGDGVDTAAFCRMVDHFMANGFNYFDTAHGYMDGKSESAVRKCLTARYPRESYVLTTKLSGSFFEKEEDIRPLFEKQLQECGVDYFDFYLMHAQDKRLFERYKALRAYETALALREEGKIRHFGISFHDKASVLEEILTAYPQIEVVQIQFNYVDYDDPSVESRRCYEVCRQFGKPVMVMEPVKGGSLVKLPAPAQAVFDGLNAGSNASYALRFAAGFEGVVAVLSGMGSMEMVQDNVAVMKDFRPLSETEMAAVQQVCAIFKQQDRIPCTACRYCTDGCPAHIAIPDLFACLNAKKTFDNWNSDFYYHTVHTAFGGKASDCLSCGRCEAACPQHLPIRELLREVASVFDKKQKEESFDD